MSADKTRQAKHGTIFRDLQTKTISTLHTVNLKVLVIIQILFPPPPNPALSSNTGMTTNIVKKTHI